MAIIKNDFYALIQKDDSAIEEFYVGERGSALLPMSSDYEGDSEEIVEFYVKEIGTWGDIWIAYNDGSPGTCIKPMTIEELTKAVDEI